MSKKLYVGNLAYVTIEDTLKEIFSQYGEVISAIVIKDRATQKSKGFGFVELADDSAAKDAISSLSGREVDGRKIRVNEAEEKAPRRIKTF